MVRKERPTGNLPVLLEIGLLLLLSGTAEARGRYSVEALLGGAKNLDTTLTIQQAGHPEIELAARYETRAFELPLYYCLRVGIQGDGGVWEVQFTHHKVYLANPTDEIQGFEITHGFNLLTVHRAWTVPVTLRLGGGIVVAHPESVVRGERSANGYELTGPAFVAGAGKQFNVSSRLFLNLEVQFTAARANVSVSGGEASSPNLALHGLVGLGLRL